MGSDDSKTIKVIDTHCHLHYDYAPKTPQQIIQEAHAAGVSHLVTVATDIASFETIQNIAEQNEHVYFTAGVHPHDVKLLDPFDLQEIKKRCIHPKCVAIGEIGLDTYYGNEDWQAQVKFLELQLEIAQEYQKTVVIHVRGQPNDATEETLLRMLKNIRTKVIIHCFSSSKDFGEACLQEGYFLSFSGIVTFKNAKPLNDFAKSVPLNQMLIETDSPFLAPVPFRGKKCEPSMVVETARWLSSQRDMGLAEFAQKTSENAKLCFGL